MRKIILSAVVLLATVAVSSAQNSEKIKKGNKARANWNKLDSAQRKTPEQLAQLQTEKLKNGLNLNEKQSKEVYQLVLDRVKTRKIEMKKRQIDFKGKSLAQPEQMVAMREQMKAKREVEMKAYNEKLQQILNKEQLDRYNQMKKKMKKSKDERRINTPSNPS